MDCVNQAVTHKRFGAGKVKSCDGKVVQVYFTQYGSRAFAYPDAFENFLRAEDPAYAQAVGAELESRRAQRAEEAAERVKALAPEPEKPVKKRAPARKTRERVKSE